ncbi:cobalt-precorrin-5B (C(1))-methyltransferase CbiD [Companilactobacillus sp.]|jgi:cobalt-precorrin-5B (C1)-methyltransferase|uniref:cobalt-precorrin-5B (C(1))-methyltransferase CbiD n=1 Tax=Companilactobacillus sp. TaxID=2767905 RepID=UPI0025BEDC1C|nr:cobalt-precorrin-5B (C(1))-methyltransferase CbiD [Companilactobacillus sp.]MCH4008627.1 cobalt-precorrin-5B (C(1))-methyltransferase CbiD [Companilactobacillus sp.]MCH4051194.1 cobalt-precorrin-5B (C(1))-methyltransferase CbiD [Companilactobacillus sp.]MCH4076570.1 cobalt-precorrin-5B (C(1))-methyltransferase CbiD [Companilactobacillus sp.]MCH4125145.1 cobalt-precorrin-5B (C(1))-methyltransferase CbiD [Companilactobacillus sp.]MCH4131685.1 cobalt-precorrin-5B (C(1))-methyltransferase CbiD 
MVEKNEQDYVYYNGKRLRKGFTTGTTATAASVAALKILLSQEPMEEITVNAANGQPAEFHLESVEYDAEKATVGIKKDGGDDQDATHGMIVYSTINLRDDNEITLDGGKGIGRVTQKGLANPPGMAAINPVPRKMIKQSVRDILGEDRGADIIISAPEGVDIAKLTYNPKLGIVGGVSILGTSGIVTPMSEESWKHSISIEMNIHRERGDEDIILTPGNYGEDFTKNVLKLPLDKQVQMSNFVGYVLHEVQRLGFKRCLMVGDLGKFIKVAGGVFSTHSKDADARAEIMVANLALMGAPQSLINDVYSSLTTISMVDYIDKAGYQKVYQQIVDRIKYRSEKLLAHRQPQVEIDAVIFSGQKFLASTQDLAVLKEIWK